MLALWKQGSCYGNSQQFSPARGRNPPTYRPKFSSPLIIKPNYSAQEERVVTDFIVITK